MPRVALGGHSRTLAHRGVASLDQTDAPWRMHHALHLGRLADATRSPPTSARAGDACEIAATRWLKRVSFPRPRMRAKCLEHL